MDVLSDLLRRAGVGDPVVRQLIARPPWSLRFADTPALTLVATLGGHAHILREGSVRLNSGDLALVRGGAPHTIADDPATPPQAVIEGGRKQLIADSPPAAPGPARSAVTRGLAPRTYGDGLPGATIMLRGAFDLRGDVGSRLLDILPPVAVVPAGPHTRAALDLLAAEIARDEPGQDAVLHRALDLVLVLALRAWCAGPDATPPGWYRALGDPAIGAALRLVHTSPDRRWTVASLAAEVGLSRAGFAARFATLVGEPPLTYLTAWRMTLGADLLRDSSATVAAVSRAVGYDDPFAFSVAFKRHRGVTPSDWRRAAPRPPES